MQKQQIIVITGAVCLFCLVYFFGRTIPPRKNESPREAVTTGSPVTFKTILAESKQELTPSQQAYINQLEVAVVRGDVKTQQIRVLNQIAAFWRDTAKLLMPYTHYLGEVAKLENSEKSLTFAAHYFLNGLRAQNDPDKKTWMATEAKELFERALDINPKNDSARVGLGSCYLFGNLEATPMTGIRMIREVTERDTTNMYAQFMLGLASIESGQFDKAIERLSKVVRREPNNLEAVLTLAESYERKGDKENAVKWYEASKKFFRESSVLDEINERIKVLKR